MYLQIYESFYHHEKKDTAHRSYQALGYVEDLITSGIPDPVSHYSEVVKKMNRELSLAKQQEKERQISSSPERFLGYFLVKNLYDSLHVSNYLDFLQYNNDFRFRLSDLLEALTYSRMVQPCSKAKTLSDIIPRLYNKYSFSYDQILEGVEHLGLEYEKVIEIFKCKTGSE